MNCVFVYGSLKPGRLRWPALEPHADVSALRDSTVRGRLWQTPYGWPALTAGTDDVPGVVVPLLLAHTAVALATLDRIEGVASGLFERVATTTADGEECWVYRWPGSTAGFTVVPGAW